MKGYQITHRIKGKSQKEARTKGRGEGAGGYKDTRTHTEEQTWQGCHGFYCWTRTNATASTTNAGMRSVGSPTPLPHSVQRQSPSGNIWLTKGAVKCLCRENTRSPDSCAPNIRWAWTHRAVVKLTNVH